MAGIVQVFRCQHCKTIHALGWPASEKPQGTKSRWVGHWRSHGLYGELTLACGAGRYDGSGRAGRFGSTVGCARDEPLRRCGALALWAMPVAAAVVGNDRMRAVLAAGHMAAERRRAAALDGTHHLHLFEADVPSVGSAPRRPMVAKYIRDLQARTGHGRGLLARPRWRTGVTHRQLLSWMRSMRPRSSRQGTPPATDNL
jgi:hypothetical protein